MIWCFNIRMEFEYFFHLWIIVTVVQAYQDERCDAENGNPIMYNTDESLCCDGKVVNHQNHQFGCHNQRIYERSKRRVCGDSLYKIASGRYECFQNREVFDTREKMVCDGVLNDRREGLVCCSDHTMNASTEVCCPVNGQYLSLSPEACCRQRTGYTELTCCGDVPHDSTTHLCCNETLFPVNGTYDCVSDSATVYDTLTGVLVNGRVEPIIDGKYRVCGYELFNPSHQICDFQTFEVQEIRSASGKMCLWNPYNRETSYCCKSNYTIYDGFPEIPDITMCGSLNSEPYLVTDTLDCEGTLYHRSPDGQMECCGTEIFNVTEKMCCRGTIVDKPTPTTECCHTSGYDSLTHTCLHSGLGDFTIRQGVYSEHQICGTEVLGENDFCATDEMFLPRKIRGGPGDNDLCGETPYNNDKLICSRRHNLFPKMPGMAVCSKSGREVLYDTSEKLCCFDTLFPRTIECGQRECCGPKPYTPEYQTCSPSYTVVDVPSNVSEICGSAVYDTRTEECDRENSLVVNKKEFRRKPSVCWVDGRPERFNNRSEICCNGVLQSTAGLEVPDCCADTAYDAASPDQICCDHVFHNTFGNPMKCEGTTAYTEEQQVCDGVLYNKTDGECCWSGVHDPQRELCCGNRVKLTKSTETERCCGTAKYDTLDSTKICCGGETLHSYVDGYKCCGTSLVDPQTHICLNDEFAISREYEASTCDPSTEHHADGTCCSGLLYVGQFGTCDGLHFIPNEDNPLWCGHRLREEGEECCGGSQIYSTSNHTCRDGRVIPLCAGEGYDPTTQTCCNNKTINNSENICCSGRVRKIENGENSCCERVAYNNRTSICCRKTVKRLDDPTTDLDECCPRDQVFSLAQDKCLEREPQVCSVFSQNKRSKKLVRGAACRSTLHAIITVTGSSSSSLEVSVTTRALSQSCPYCEPSSSGNRILKRIRTINLPEGCMGSPLPLNRKFLLLDSSIPDTESRSLQLTEDARIFRRGAANIVLKTYQEGCS